MRIKLHDILGVACLLGSAILLPEWSEAKTAFLQTGKPVAIDLGISTLLCSAVAIIWIPTALGAISEFLSRKRAL